MRREAHLPPTAAHCLQPYGIGPDFAERFNDFRVAYSELHGYSDSLGSSIECTRTVGTHVGTSDFGLSQQTRTPRASPHARPFVGVFKRGLKNILCDTGHLSATVVKTGKWLQERAPDTPTKVIPSDTRTRRHLPA